MLTKDLPITRDTKKLRNLIISSVANFSKRFKYTLGENLVKSVLTMSKHIRRANESMDKATRAKHIQEIRFLIGDISDLVDCAIEFQVMSTKQLAQFATIVDSIGKQATGWLNSVR